MLGQFWHPVFGFTSFIELDSTDDDRKIDAFKSLPVYVYEGGGYDGVSYAQIAYHPTLTSPELARALGSPAYRARRILAPALAYVIALGSPTWIVHVYSLLNPAFWLLLATLLWRLLPVRDWRSWLAWAGVLFSSGAMSSVRLALTDLVALTILAGALRYAERARPAGDTFAAGIVAAAALARETSLLAIAAIVQPPWISWRNARRVALAAAPLAIWSAYVSWVLGNEETGLSQFTLPFAGLVGKIGADLAAVRDHTGSSFAWTTMFTTVGLIVQATFFATRLRFRDAWWRAGAVYALMMMVLGMRVWEGFPGAAARVLLPMSLAFNVVATRSGARLIWLLAGNLAVLNGLQVIRDVPDNPHELGAGHAGGAAIVARSGGDWYGVDRDSRHRRAWSPWRGEINLETWPHDTRTVSLVASVRSLAPIVLTVRQNDAVVWRNTILPSFPRPMKLEVSCSVRGGHGHLELLASPSGQLEPPIVQDRPPVFAVEDVRFAVARGE
jgi:hypothetical protein